MSAEEKGHPFLPVEVSHEIEETGSGRGVQIRRRLVGQDEFGFGRQGAGYSDALLLAAGKFAWSIVGSICQANCL